MATTILRFQNIQKSFDGICALKDVNFDVYEGDCLAIVGENGAGKSTLMKILSGVWPHGSYQGEIFFNGGPLRVCSPVEGQKTGISIIHQELCLFPKLTVAENIFLMEGAPYDGTPSQNLFTKVRWPQMMARARQLFDDLGFAMDVRRPVEELSVAERQLVEIARAFHHRSKILILDEPTSALSVAEVRHLFNVIERFRGTMTFIYISHKLEEVFELSNRIVVMRDGQAVATLETKATNAQEVIRHMVGRPLNETAHRVRAFTGPAAFEVSQLSHMDEGGKKLLEGISFQVRKGEILGIAGLMGSGRSELLRSVLGILPGKRAGEVRLEGKTVQWRSIQEAMEEGAGFVPEDRKKDGLFLNHGVDFNLTISILRELLHKSGAIDLAMEQSKAESLAQQMNVKCARMDVPIKTLSGGNQQKVLLAKVVACRPKILMLDEPTRGIDVGAKEEIYAIIRQLAASGLAVILVSSELPEVLSLSDRVLVLREGKAVGEMVNDGLTQERVMTFAAGGSVCEARL